MNAESSPTATSIRELAKALGVSVGKAHGLVRQPWFPQKGASGWVVAACLAAIEALRNGETLTAPAAPEPAPARANGETLTAPASSPATEIDALEISRDAVRRAQQLLVEGNIVELPRHLETLKRCLEELRRTEAGALELGKRRGELIPLEDARAAGAQLGGIFVQALERIAATIGTQVEMWIDEDSFRALGPEGRARAVRAWIDSKVRTLRYLTADEIDKVIAVARESAQA